MVELISIAAVVLTGAYSAYLAFGKGRPLPVYAFVAALAATGCSLAFDFLAITYPEDFHSWKKASLVSESLLPVSWLLFSATFSRSAESISVSTVQKALLAASLAFPAAAILLPQEQFFYSPDFASERMLFLGRAGFIFYSALMAYMIVAAINIEATLRGAHRAARWKIKFETLGSGALLALFIFYYSQALLYRAIDMDLLVVRSAVLIVAVSLMAYSRLMRGNGVKVQVSKDMAYRSIVIFMVGLYLIGLGFIGEGMRYYGESIKRDMVVLLAFLSGLALVIVLLSENIKRKIQVFLHKNFFSNKYDYRVQWLQFTDRLSSSKSRNDVLRAIIAGFADTFGMKGAALFLLDEERGVFSCESIFEMDINQSSLPAGSRVVSAMEEKGRVYYHADGADACSDEDREFISSNGICFMAPLFMDGSVKGLVVLGMPINRNEIYTYEDYDLMKTLSRQASSTILNLRLSDELSRARQMEAIGKVSAFVIHDLKNHVSTLSLLTDNAADYMDDPEFQKDMVVSLRVTVDKMKGLISKLRELKEKNSLNLRQTELGRLARETVKTVSGEIRVSGSEVYAEVDPEELQKVILNLVINGIEAGGGKGPVAIELGMKESGAFISVADLGCGMTQEFMRNRLFKPFSTTKIKGIGIGLYQCRQIIEAHGGSIEVRSETGKGTVFTVCLPSVRREEMTKAQAGASTGS
ncbi:Sensor protein ZraS [uncultured bacterium]|nr:Sensor protein ZraS [uncultured bacterium]